MTLSTLIINIGIVAAILTLVVGLGLKKHKSWVMTFLQNFCGVLFIFSGWVKAIDPMGTAFKMEQYFAAFEATFSETWMSFIAPIFPLFSEYSIGFSVFMIVFEIVLGIMLVLGSKAKWVSWAFFLLVAFFTVLTGFTYLTGYVPTSTTFFDFSNWGPYNKNNMQVTDCGCFGDFLKLEPKVSFFKDIALLIPSLYFIFRNKDMHELVSNKWSNIIIGLSTVGLIFYCLNNFVWNLPQTDFRPFKAGAEVTKIKEQEEEAAGNVQVIDFVMKNKETGEVFNLPYNDYMSNFAAYPKDKFETIDQIKTEAAIPKTKISDFVIETFDGGDVTDKYLYNEKYHFMLVSYKLKYESEPAKITMTDTVMVMDTVFNTSGEVDTILTKTNVIESVKEGTNYIWKGGLSEDMVSIGEFARQAIKDGHEVSWVIGGVSQDKADDLKDEFNLPIEFYTADDILLKTIVRSNPGIVLWHNGVILNKWHKNKLPAYSVVKSQYLK